MATQTVGFSNRLLQGRFIRRNQWLSMALMSNSQGSVHASPDQSEADQRTPIASEGPRFCRKPPFITYLNNIVNVSNSNRYLDMRYGQRKGGWGLQPPTRSVGRYDILIDCHSTGLKILHVEPLVTSSRNIAQFPQIPENTFADQAFSEKGIQRAHSGNPSKTGEIAPSFFLPRRNQQLHSKGS